MITKKCNLRDSYDYIKYVDVKPDRGAIPAEYTGDATDLPLLDNGELCRKVFGEITNGSTFFDMDNSKVYMWKESVNNWKEI